MNEEYTQAQREDALRGVLTFPGLARPDFAVAAPLVFGRGGPFLLIEVRAAGISQAGDPCFPGGRVEPGETPAEAAAREFREELGIRTDPAAFLGQLPTVHTPLGGRTNVYVCTVPPEDDAAIRINPDEVSELLRVPLAFFLSDPDAANWDIGPHTVWGMTAGAIRYLCRAWNRAAARLKAAEQQ